MKTWKRMLLITLALIPIFSLLLSTCEWIDKEGCPTEVLNDNISPNKKMPDD